MPASNSSHPIIAYSVGEPAGIGPDLAIQLAQQPRNAEVLAIADPQLLLARAAKLQLPLKLTDHPTVAAGELWVQPITLTEAVTPGLLNAANAQYVLNGITLATELCLKGEADAMLTGPVHKGIINSAGVPFTGHTEWIAKICGREQVVMMLVNDNLRVALATTHIPLVKVSEAITKDCIESTIRIVQQELIDKFAMTKPRIGVCGLNPHAGESGHIGREEVETITPALDKLRNEGMDITGPLPADTVFSVNQRNQYDVIVALYHDQGLSPFKALSFGEAVNITLGLPIIRTSVDHGTALDLAGTGKADWHSLLAAMNLAIQLVSNRRKGRV